MNNDDDDSDEEKQNLIFKTIKVKMKPFIRDNKLLDKIKDIVSRINLLTTYGYMFIKAYLIYCDNNNIDCKHVFNKEFAIQVLSLLGTRTNGRGVKSEFSNNLLNFYNKEFKHIHDIMPPVKYEYMSYIMAESAKEIYRSLKHNIKLNYQKRVIKFLKITIPLESNKSYKYYSMYNQLLYLKEQHQYDEFTDVINKYRSYIATDYKDTSKIYYTNLNKYKDAYKTLHEKYPDWDEKRVNKKLKKNGITKPTHPFYEDYKDNYYKLLKYELYINNYIEQYNNDIINRQNKCVKQCIKNIKDYDNYCDDCKIHQKKLCNPISIRDSFIPKSIAINTNALLMLVGYKTYKNEIKFKRLFWNRFFNLDDVERKYKKYKKYNYEFYGTIHTNGVSASILISKKHNKKDVIEDFDKVVEEFKYLNELDKEELNKLKNNTLVGVDPGINTLIYMNGNNKCKLRYTKIQRQFETREKYYKKIRQQIKTNEIQKIEDELSHISIRTTQYNTYMKNIKERCKLLSTITKHYDQITYRIMAYKSFTKKQQSIDKLINEIKKIYGEDAKLLFGNWSRNPCFKGQPPTKGKGLRKRLGKEFDLYIIDEHKTSSHCNCDGKVGKFKKILNPKPYKKDKIILCHSLLRCKNVDCERLWNRDDLGSRNILKIGMSIINGNGIPAIFRRNYSSV